jgi:hypothetical protein
VKTVDMNETPQKRTVLRDLKGSSGRSRRSARGKREANISVEEERLPCDGQRNERRDERKERGREQNHAVSAGAERRIIAHVCQGMDHRRHDQKQNEKPPHAHTVHHVESARMQRDFRQQLDAFLRPLYQELDGASRMDEVERIATIARRLGPPPADDRHFELLLLFHRLGRWLEKLGNLSRATLVIPSLTEEELRRVAQSIRRLDMPETEAERAVAAAILIDGAGVRGIAEQISRSRREGSSLMDVLRAALSDVFEPEWLPAQASVWLRQRRESRRLFCRTLLEEISLEDLSLPDLR